MKINDQDRSSRRSRLIGATPFVNSRDWPILKLSIKVGYVILSEAKNLGLASEILRFAQNDMAKVALLADLDW